MTQAEKIWTKFRRLEGSHGIASLYALDGLIKLIRTKKPKKILEVGAGIGTLTYTILTVLEDLKVQNYKVVTVENNDFCLRAMSRNLKDFEGKYQLVKDPAEFKESGQKYDLLVIDGGGVLSGDIAPIHLGNRIGSRGRVFIEGTREYQREKIENVWYKDRKFSLSRHCSIYPQVTWIGQDRKPVEIGNKGYWVYQFEPTPSEQIGAWFQNILLKVILRLRAVNFSKKIITHP